MTKSDESLNQRKTINANTKDIESSSSSNKPQVTIKESNYVEAFSEKAKRDIEDMQQAYAEKEGQVLTLLKFNSDKPLGAAADNYEKILTVHIKQLQEIVKNDFSQSNKNSKKLIEETKSKLNGLLDQVFDASKASTANSNFQEAATALFEDVNHKIKKDLSLESKTVQKTADQLSPDVAKLFRYPLRKTNEEAEAERLLRNVFEAQILEFNNLVRQDFQNMNELMESHVKEAKDKFLDIVQSVKVNEVPKVNSVVSDTRSMPSLPSGSTVKQNLNTIFNKTGQDFENARENMLKDVEKNKEIINENAKYYTDKFLGMCSMCKKDDDG